jgi:hypothetical protein
MMRILAATLLIALTSGLLWAAPLAGDKTYDMLFRNGTLDEIDRDASLVYSREVTNALLPEAAERDTGDIALKFRDTATTMALLEFHQDGRHRALGQFPASVGNPIIMFFYESVVRDMAEAAGGSPFYIRNRVKEALVSPSDVEEGEAVLDGKTVPTRTVRLYPFRDDPNQDRMRGFGDLELRVTMSDAVPGWYVSLVAESSDGQVYRSELKFEGLNESP